MKISAVHHIHLKVGDVEVARQFYVDVMGFEVDVDRPKQHGPGFWLNTGGPQLHVSIGTTPELTGQHFALEIDDFDEALAEFESAGVEVIRKPSGSKDEANVFDPSGNLIELRRPAHARWNSTSSN